MEELEFKGKSIDDAIEKACSRFQVSRDKLKIEIIAAGSPGFLGIGATKARISASRLSIDIALETLFDGADTEAPARNEHGKPPVHDGRQAAKGDFKSDANKVKRIRRHHDTLSATPPANETTKEKFEHLDSPATVRPKPSHPADQKLDGEPPGDKAKRLLEGILSRMQISSPVDVEETDEAIILNIRGDGSGLLIGKRGQNLDAIQYIVNKAVHHTSNGHKMIVIDTEEYRKRREESLVALAMKLGEKVKKTKKPVTVGHMNAHDRRVIHMAMQGDSTLTTKSRGEGEYRKIVILPARRGPDTSTV